MLMEEDMTSRSSDAAARQASNPQLRRDRRASFDDTNRKPSNTRPRRRYPSLANVVLENW